MSAAGPTDRPVLVTGGAGFIGSHLVDRLLASGHTVVCLDNLDDFYSPDLKRLNQRAHREHNAYHFEEGDIRDRDLISTLFKRYDLGCVIHLAAKAGVRPSLHNPGLYTAVNVTGTQVLLEAIRKVGVEKFIFASSSSVYGNNSKTPFSEKDRVDQPVSPYGATKRMGELLCYTYHHLYRIPTTCLRFFTVYGPRQRPEMAIHKFVRLLHRGAALPFFGDGTTARDYTYIDDIVDGIIKALKKEDDFMIYNLGNSAAVPLHDLVQIIAEVTGLEVHLDRQELPPGDVVRTCADLQRARHRLNYRPTTPIRTGIRKFVDWYAAGLTTHRELLQ